HLRPIGREQPIVRRPEEQLANRAKEQRRRLPQPQCQESRRLASSIFALRMAIICGLTSELSGRCREELQSTPCQHCSGPLERIVRQWTPPMHTREPL